MTNFSRMLSAAGLALSLALGAGPVIAQQKAPAPATAAPPLKEATPAAIAAAKEILAMKNAIVAKNLAGREKEIGDGMAKVYANEFTEQELKDLVTFYKSPLGQKLLASEPRAIQFSMSYMNAWAQNFAEVVNAQFRAEMRKRGKEI